MHSLTLNDMENFQTGEEFPECSLSSEDVVQKDRLFLLNLTASNIYEIDQSCRLHPSYYPEIAELITKQLIAEKHAAVQKRGYVGFGDRLIGWKFVYFDKAGTKVCRPISKKEIGARAVYIEFN